MNIIHPVATKPTAMPPRSFALYGEAKVGKSDLASKFPTPLFIDMENRLHNIAAPRTSLITSAADLKQVLAEILADHRAGKFPFATVVLDGLSTFILSAGFHEDSKDSRAIAKAMAKLFLPALDDYFALPLIRVITLHARVEKREKKIRDGNRDKTIEYTSIAPDLHPRIEQYFTAKVDAIGYCQTKGGARTITWAMQDTAEGRTVAGNSLGLPASTPLSYADIARHLIAPAKPANGKVEAPEPKAEVTTSEPEPAPAPAPAKATNGNGNGHAKAHPPTASAQPTKAIAPARTPDAIRQHIGKKTLEYQGRTVKEIVRGMLVSALEICFAGDAEASTRRRIVVKWLTDCGSLSPETMPAPVVLALQDWIKPYPDGGGLFHPNPMAVTEVQAVYQQAINEAPVADLQATGPANAPAA